MRGNETFFGALWDGGCCFCNLALGFDKLRKISLSKLVGRQVIASRLPLTINLVNSFNHFAGGRAERWISMRLARIAQIPNHSNLQTPT